MQAKRYRYEDLLKFSSGLLRSAGLPLERATTVAGLFLEADLLGYSTHGLQRLPTNIDWLLKGETNRDGHQEVLSATATCETWDANFLPGPWVTAMAVDRACDLASQGGIGTVAIRHAQHVACLAAYLGRATDRHMLVMMTVSTPAEAVVAAHGGLSRIFSCNPIAAGIPTDARPILIDTTVAMSALGPMHRAHRLGTNLPVPMIISPAGDLSDDPAEFVERDGAILPLGGVEQGYKGYSIALLTEALSGALSGFGRSDTAATGEANAVFVQVIDPSHFAGRSVFEAQMGRLAATCRSSAVAPGQDPVRVPGDRALDLKSAQLKNGVTLIDAILDDVKPWAERFECSLPAPIG